MNRRSTLPDGREVVRSTVNDGDPAAVGAELARLMGLAPEGFGFHHARLVRDLERGRRVSIAVYFAPYPERP